MPLKDKNMNYKEKTNRVFNKFFSSFLKDIKEVDDDLRKLVKVSYKSIDKTSSEYCDFVVASVISHLEKIKLGSFDDDEVREVTLAKGLSLGIILEKVEDKKDDKVIVLNYIYILVLFAYMSTLEDEDELFTQVVRVLGYIQAKNFEEYNNEKDDIIDDDIKDLLEKIKEYDVTPKVQVKNETPSGKGGLSDIFGALENSKIADLAKEIAKDVDLSSLQGENPDDMIKNMLDFGSGNNVLGNIISKVSATLNNKITSGELKHDELLGEAMSMMNMFNDGNNPLASNPLFANMMKAMKTGNVNVKQDVMKKCDTRERLRKKLEMKKKNVE
jgi:hypothetical protein